MGIASVPASILRLAYKPTPAQYVASAVSAEEILYGGAWGGGKTVWLVQQCVQWLSKFPGIRGFLGRRTLPSLRMSVLETWREQVPKELYLDHKRDQFMETRWGSRLYYGGIVKTSDKEMDWSKGTEFGFLAIDQIEELTERQYLDLKGRCRQMLPCGVHPPFRQFLTCNPRANWVKKRFITSPVEGSAFIKALPADNPYLREDYEDVLRRDYRHHPELIAAFVDGNWEGISGFDLVISETVALNAQRVEMTFPWEKRWTSVDPSRMGDDRFVIFNWLNGKIVERMVTGKKSNPEGAAHCKIMADRNKSTDIFVEEDGIGGGVLDNLRLLYTDRPDMGIQGVMMGSAADDPKKYKNKRAEVWFLAAEVLGDNQAMLPQDDELIAELTSVHYEVVGKGLLQVESKEDIKAANGRSPDLADACVLGLAHMAQVREVRLKPQAVRPRGGDSPSPSDRFSHEYEAPVPADETAESPYDDQ